MTFVEIIDGALELRWTWLPYWLATNGKLKQEIEDELRAAVSSNLLTDDPARMAELHSLVCKRIQERFPEMLGLEDALKAFERVSS